MTLFLTILAAIIAAPFVFVLLIIALVYVKSVFSEPDPASVLGLIFWSSILVTGGAALVR